MAFVYEINGQRVEFEKEPTEADIDEAARSLRPAPQPTRKVVEGAGGGAIVYPNMGRRPESQQDREASKEMPIQTARGVVTGALGAPSDILNLPGVLYSAATQQPQPYKVPLGSESWNEMLPFKSDAPSAKLARLGGEVMAPFPTVKGLQTIPKAAGAIGDVVSGAVGTGTGYIARPGRTPRGYQQPSQRNPIGSTYTPPEEFAKFERGELPYGQMPEQRPISELPQGKLDQAAMMLSGGNIPNAGQGARAFGERLGETYRNPLTAAADIGSMFFTGGVPVLTTLRGGLAGAQALADMRLANKGFTPELPKILEEYQTGVRPLPGVQPGPMPRDFMANGPVSPGGMAAATPAAQAAMATTQRVARQPAAPRPPAQPRVEWTLPDAGTHYAQAAQGSTNFGDTFNRAVAARKADLLKDSQKRGQKMTAQQAEDIAFEEIKLWRSQNVPEFAPTPQAPELVGPVKPADVAMAETKRTQEIQNAANQQRIEKMTWESLQQRIANGGKPMFNEQKFIDDIITKYGEDPFGTGKINSGVASAPIETPAPTKKRDMSLNNASNQFTKDIEELQKNNTLTNDQFNAEVDKLVKKYEIVTTKKQMRVYDEAYDAAIAEGKDVESARRAGNKALQRNKLPPMFGDESRARRKPKDTHKQETAMAQAWFDDTIKNADKQTKQMYQDMLDRYNGDVAQLWKDISAQKAGKTTGISTFEEPLDQADTGKYNTMPETKPTPVVETPAPTKPLTKKEQRQKEKWEKNQAEVMEKVKTPYQPGITGESKQTFNNLVEHMRNRGYMAGVERDKLRVKQTGEVFTPTTLVDEMLSEFPKEQFTNPTKTFLDSSAGDGQFLSEVVLRKIQNGSTHKQALETTYGVDIMPDNVKALRDRLIGGNESLRPIAEQNLLVGNGLDPFDKVPGQTALDRKRMIELFGENHIESLKESGKKADKQKALELQKEYDSYNFEPEKSTPPPDVMEMKTGGKVFDNKADYEAQVLLDRLAGKPTTGSFVDNGMRYEITEIDYGNVPKDVLKRMNKPLTQVRVFTEKSNKQISGPPPEVPEKSLRERVEEKMRKRK